MRDKIIKVLKMKLSTWKSPINVNHYHNYFVVFMVTLYFLDGKLRLRKVCWLSQITNPSPSMRRVSCRRGRSSLTSCSGRVSLSVLLTNANATMRREEGGQRIGRGENAIHADDAILPYTQHRCTLCSGEIPASC